MKRKYPETEMYKEIKKWKKNHMRLYPSLERLHHIPNDGKRKPWVADKLGIRSGVSDFHYAARTDKYIGFYLEIKDKGKKPTENQHKWMSESREYGYQADWCDTLQSAFLLIETYARQVEAYRKGNKNVKRH